MKKFSLLLILTLAAVACTLPSTTATPLPTDVPLLTLPTPTLTPEVSVLVPFSSGGQVIEDPSFLFIDFLDTQNGWGLASGDTGYAETHQGSPGYILRTQDGGATWTDATPPGVVDVYHAARLTVLDVDTVWALVPDLDFVTGTLYHTVDGGETWTSSTTPFGGASIQFLDPMVGRAMADRGVGAGSNAVEIYQTSDAGATWTSVFLHDPSEMDAADNLPLSGVKNGMTFLDADTGWITGTRPMDGEIYFFVTHDGGASWAMQPLSLPAEYELNQYNPLPPFFFGQDGFLPLIIYFPSGNIEQTFYLTHDGGATWIGDPKNASQVVIPGYFSFIDALTGFSWNGGTDMFFTTDGAQSWSGMGTSLDLSDSLSSIDFVDSSTGWALTGPFDSGLTWLYRTEDAGATWTQLIP